MYIIILCVCYSSNYSSHLRQIYRIHITGKFRFKRYCFQLNNDIASKFYMIKKHINLSGFSCYNNLFLTSNKGKTRSKFQQNLQSIYTSLTFIIITQKFFSIFCSKPLAVAFYTKQDSLNIYGFFRHIGH